MSCISPKLLAPFRNELDADRLLDFYAYTARYLKSLPPKYPGKWYVAIRKAEGAAILKFLPARMPYSTGYYGIPFLGFVKRPWPGSSWNPTHYLNSMREHSAWFVSEYDAGRIFYGRDNKAAGLRSKLETTSKLVDWLLAKACGEIEAQSGYYSGMPIETQEDAIDAFRVVKTPAATALLKVLLDGPKGQVWDEPT